MGVGTRSRLWIRRRFGTGRGKYWVGLVLQITIYYTKRIDLNLISEKCHSTVLNRVIFCLQLRLMGGLA